MSLLEDMSRGQVVSYVNQKSICMEKGIILYTVKVQVAYALAYSAPCIRVLHTLLQSQANGYDQSLWRRSCYKAFLVFGGKKRSDVHGRLNAIRRFRNRIAHHANVPQ